MTRNIHCPKLYEALDYLKLTLDKAWLVKRYRDVLRGGDLAILVAINLRHGVLGSKQGKGSHGVPLSLHFSDNKRKIDRLRKVLEIVRKSFSGS